MKNASKKDEVRKMMKNGAKCNNLIFNPYCQKDGMWRL